MSNPLPLGDTVSDGTSFYGTSGTLSYLASLQEGCTSEHAAHAELHTIASYTASPEMLGGRVKSLHPRVFGSILAREGRADDLADVAAHDLTPFDLVIVDLYPFEAAVASGKNLDECIELIDIGGIALLRAAAKNGINDRVLVVGSPATATTVLQALRTGKPVPQEVRRAAALDAFRITCAYDGAIAGWLAGTDTDLIRHATTSPLTLRYGENPHQDAVFHGQLSKQLTQLQGKALSFNNLVDVDAALGLLDDLSAINPNKPAFVIVKHTNACGAAFGENLADAYTRALAGDPVSAFGGILVCNRQVDTTTATLLVDLFFDILVAPSFSDDATARIAAKSAKRTVCRRADGAPPLHSARRVKTALGGILVQDDDRALLTTSPAPDLVRTTAPDVVPPNPSEWADIAFADALVKHSKSNAIVLVRGGQLLGSGVGQCSRVDATSQAIAKAGRMGFSTTGAILASDAFFPFPDCVMLAADAGVRVIVQPGGSIRDDKVIAAAQERKVAMVVTGTRHFRH